MPEQSADIVVVGGGLAAAKTVEALREKGFDGSLTLIGSETELPYERPPLSKDYLQGKAEFGDAVVALAASGTTSTTSPCGSARPSRRSTSRRANSPWTRTATRAATATASSSSRPGRRRD